jgi:hypothetical protein
MSKVVALTFSALRVPNTLPLPPHPFRGGFHTPFSLLVTAHGDLPEPVNWVLAQWSVLSCSCFALFHFGSAGIIKGLSPCQACHWVLALVYWYEVKLAQRSFTLAHTRGLGCDQIFLDAVLEVPPRKRKLCYPARFFCSSAPFAEMEAFTGASMSRESGRLQLLLFAFAFSTLSHGGRQFLHTERWHFNFSFLFLW